MQILSKETLLAPYKWLIHDINIKNEQNDLTSLTDPNQPHHDWSMLLESSSQ